MKVLFEPVEAPSPSISAPVKISFPAGIIGFPEHHDGEIFGVEDQAPFLWLRLHGPTLLHFVVIDPTGVVADYAPELFDDDAAAIGIAQSSDAQILNIVTVHTPDEATVNLVGPIVVNRQTGMARQMVVANHNQFSARHALVTNS
jgi:flagellar assembly factor FliW